MLFVSPCYLPATRFGGPVQSIHQLARGLREAGLEADVFTTNSDGPADLRVPLEEPVRVDGVPVTYFPVRSPRSYFRSPRLRAALRASVSRYDVVYAAWMYVDTTISATDEAHRAGVPYVVSPRGMLDTHAVRKKGRLRKWAWLRLLGAGALQRAAAVHFTSRGELENAIVRPREGRALVIPNGMVLAPASPAPREMPALPPGPMVLFLGRLNYIKGLDMLVDAWPAVVKAVPTASLVLAGPDDHGLYASLRASLAASGTEGSVHYVGLVGPDVRDELLRRCAVLANPSYLESFGMAIVEAMGAGRAVVVTDRVNIARDIEAAGAGSVVRCDAGEIAAAIVGLLQDRERAERMGLAGRELVAREYSLPSVARRMAAALEAAAKTRTRS